MALPEAGGTTTATRPTSTNALVQAVWNETAKIPGLTATHLYRLRLSMLSGAGVEGGWGPNFGPPGDGGNSWGFYQINLPFHPKMNRDTARDPVLATRYMLPAYLGALQAVGDGPWANPEMAARTVAYKAERPKVIYDAKRWHNSYLQTISAIGGGGSAATGNMGAFPGITTIAKNLGGNATPNRDSECLIKMPGINPPGPGEIGGNCLLNRGQARALLGGAIVVGGVATIALGVVLVSGKSIAGVVQPAAALVPHPAAQAIAGAAGKQREFVSRRHGVRMTELDAREMAAGARQASAESKLVRAQPGGKGRSVPFTEETTGNEPF